MLHRWYCHRWSGCYKTWRNPWEIMTIHLNKLGKFHLHNSKMDITTKENVVECKRSTPILWRDSLGQSDLSIARYFWESRACGATCARSRRTCWCIIATWRWLMLFNPLWVVHIFKPPVLSEVLDYAEPPHFLEGDKRCKTKEIMKHYPGEPDDTYLLYGWELSCCLRLWREW